MSVEVIISEKKIVYCAPVTDATQKWGVYCLPRLWRMPDGILVIRFNGEQDTSDINNLNVAKTLHFVSKDNGESWFEDDGSKYDIAPLLGIGSPYLFLPSGDVIAVREKADRKSIKNTKHYKEFLAPNGEAIIYTYKYGELPEETKGIEVLTYKSDESVPKVEDANLCFDEQEIFVHAKAHAKDGYRPVDQYIRPSFFRNPYITALNYLKDGTIVALTSGQNPLVPDRYCCEVYLMESKDNGKNWTKRSTVASDIENLPFGYGGDGPEISLCVAQNGDLICAMRMDMSIDPRVAKPICDTMIAISSDNGYSWCTPFSVADSSVTPQVVSLGNGIVVVAYGRPGVHFKYSEDYGKTWSESYSIIGLTLEQERANGRKDEDSKYFDSCSYSNLFVEKISEDSFLVLTTDLKYDDGDGLNHKAGFVRKITIKRK